MRSDAAPAYLNADSGISFGELESLGAPPLEPLRPLPGQGSATWDAGAVLRCVRLRIAMRDHVGRRPGRPGRIGAGREPGPRRAGRLMARQRERCDATGPPGVERDRLRERGHIGRRLREAREPSGSIYARNLLVVGPWHICAEPTSPDAGFSSDVCRSVHVAANRTATDPVAAASYPAPSAAWSEVRPVDGSAASRSARPTRPPTADRRTAARVTRTERGLSTACRRARTRCASQRKVRRAQPIRPADGRRVCIESSGVVAGADRSGFDHTLAPGGAVSGTITDSSGRPDRERGCRVPSWRRFQPWNTSVTTSARDGHFRMTGLTPGSYRVCAELDYASGSVTGKCRLRRVTVVARKVTPACSRGRCRKPRWSRFR